MSLRILKSADIFDWRSVPDANPDDVALWLGRTDAKDRGFPLQVALQVHDELERELMSPSPLEDARLREIRGGLKALARFAQVYGAAINPPRPRKAPAQ